MQSWKFEIVRRAISPVADLDSPNFASPESYCGPKCHLCWMAYRGCHFRLRWAQLGDGHLIIFKTISFFLDFKGTASLDWDGLLVVWMDRALAGDKPLIVFKTICCFLFLISVWLSSEVLHKGCLFVWYWGNPLADLLEVVGNPLANFGGTGPYLV